MENQEKEKCIQEKKHPPKWCRLLIASIIVLAVVSVFGSRILHHDTPASEQEISEYNEAVKSYNTVADEYREIRGLASLKTVDNLPAARDLKTYLDENTDGNISKDTIDQNMLQIQEETANLNAALSFAHSAFNQKIVEYNDAVTNYNAVADEYTKIQAIKSLENIDNLPTERNNLTPLTPDTEVSAFVKNAASQDAFVQNLEPLVQETEKLKEALTHAYSAFNQKIAEYNDAIANYKAVADEYTKIQAKTSLENIDNLPTVKVGLTPLEANVEVSAFVKNAPSQDAFIQNTESLIQETEEILYALILAQQITNPSEKWVIDRLKSVSGILDVQAVTKDHDPNQLLNVDGGYTSCTYFSASGVKQGTISGTSIIDKGTDAGGAIEVYKTVTDARNRCEYLGQFDNTLLYSGSYAILGTTVIRTSYLLTNEQQVELTNKITNAFTALR